MIKAIASDIDGTLLQNHSREISPRLHDLLLRILDKGIVFIAASGRQYSSLYSLFSPISDKFYYAGENGCICAHDTEIIQKFKMPQDAAYQILDEILALPDCEVMVSGVDTVYIEDNNKLMTHIIENELQYKATIVKDIRNNIPEPILKVAAFDENGTERIWPYFHEKYHGEITAATAGIYWVDFASIYSNKGTGVKAILDHLGIDPKDCIAFGDQFNDVEMLQLAGKSYVVATHAPGVEKYADGVINSVEDVLEEILAELDAEEK